jgi:ketosteroid isomerase-like protein
VVKYVPVTETPRLRPRFLRRRAPAPPARNVDVARRICEANSRRDFKASSALLDRKRMRWDIFGFDEVGNEALSWRSYEQVLEFLRDWLEAWEELVIEPTDILDFGEEVVVLLRVRGRGLGVGLAIERRFAEVWTLREGKAVRYRLYRATVDAFKVVEGRD